MKLAPIFVVLLAATPARSGIPSACVGETPAPERASGLRPSYGGHASSSLVVTPDGRTVLVVNPDSGTVSILDARRRRVRAEAPVGASPRGIALSRDARRAYVANEGDGTVAVLDLGRGRTTRRVTVGGRPYALLAGPSGVFVTDPGRWELLKLDSSTLRELARVPTAPFPSGLALTGDGERLLVAHLTSADVSVFDAATLHPLGVISGGLDATGAREIVVSTDGTRAYVPLTRVNPTNPAALFDGILFPAVNVLDLSAARALVSERLFLDVIGRPSALPGSAALSPDGARLYVANAGGNDVAVIDMSTRLAQHPVEVGAGPSGVRLSPDGAVLYVSNALDGTLSFIDTRMLAETARIKVARTRLPERIARGKRLFHSARPRSLSRDRWVACASCHLEGGHDGRTWSLRDGARNTPALAGAAVTGPWHWNGDRDELQDVDRTIRDVHGGAGLLDLGPKPVEDAARAGRSPELDALAAYVASLEPALSPCVPAAGVLSARAERGRAAFERLGCVVCHPPPLYTDRRRHGPTGGAIDTPSLKGVWASAPHLHDGSAATLLDVLRPAQSRTGEGPHAAQTVGAEELDDVLAYLRSLPYETR